MPVSKKVKSIPISGTLYISEIAKNMEKRGKRVLRLDIGDLNFPTPHHIVKAVNEAIERGMTHYSSSKGLRELREAIANKYNEAYGIDLDPDKNVIITPGAKFALYAVLFSILEEKDEVLIPAPCWVSYEGIVRACGGEPRIIKTKGLDFRIDYESLTRVKTKRRVKALILNTPNNPTGRIYSLKELKEIRDFSEEEKIFVISDEVYDSIVFEGRHISMMELMDPKEKCIIVNSFSKKYAMTGWRLGYIIASEEIIQCVNRLLQQTISCVPPFIQWAGYVALTSEESKRFVKEMREELRRRRDILDSGLKSINGLTYRRPEATFYYFIRIPFDIPSLDFSKKLLMRYGIATVPGVFFGGYDNYIRISFGSVSIEEIRTFISEFSRALEEMQNAQNKTIS
ncbi:MAG: pyridoxal phosphate-dependent aminotransferase [Thermoprotei archaeon]|nr:MAG: pyridoxal phosphate-dependent aminotransferase [Thermoprotei archaeon]